MSEKSQGLIWFLIFLVVGFFLFGWPAVIVLTLILVLMFVMDSIGLLPKKKEG